MFDYKECLRLRLLRRIPPSSDKAEKSIRVAKNKWLKEAEGNLRNGSFNSSLICSYLAMFHSARAILYFDGLREKSHACIGRYLEEIYANKGLLERKWVELFDHYKDLRDDDQYSFSFYTTKEEAKNALKTAKEFVGRMFQLLRQKKEKGSH